MTESKTYQNLIFKPNSIISEKNFEANNKHYGYLYDLLVKKGMLLPIIGTHTSKFIGNEKEILAILESLSDFEQMAIQSSFEKSSFPILSIENFNIHILKKHILKSITLDFYSKRITAIMGPSGCGKTTLIRSINRLNDLIPNVVTRGKILYNNQNILDINPSLICKEIGMVFQRPNPFPSMSIFENTLAGYILGSIRLEKEEKKQIVEENLKKVGLWDEVKDDIHRKGTFLSGGQQQRLCIARALAMNPSILLLDEPTSALDPRSTAIIESLIMSLRKTVTIIMVTHNIAQASRISDNTVFLYLGELIEEGATSQLFTTPKHQKTEEYLTRKFG